ncbi:BON1-associated protein 2 [Rosa rugosa]|uniref:BON1-associated protein 2 n=1 Tax=Rosa rugosa TaxID=74645 RepID=UPI002B40BE7D|nr:BON1-associated protein 2 [Rosa rugosa]
MKRIGGVAEKMHVLEINLISGQGLKVPSGKLRRMKTYAIAWVDSDHKIRTRVDKVGAENPTWNDRFLFKVSSEFLARETSGITIEIYAVGVIRDHLVGTVRLILSNFLDLESKIPSFTALQIRRPSGRFHGVLNVAALVNHESEWSKELDDVSAIGYQDLMGKGESFRRRRRRDSLTRSTENFSGSESRENSCAESVENSDCGDSFKSASPPYKSPSKPTSPAAEKRALKEANGVRDLAAGTRALKTAVASDGSRFLCCLLTTQRKVQSSSDKNAER